MEPPIHSLMQNQEKKVGVTDPHFRLKQLIFHENPQKSPLLEKNSPEKSNGRRFLIFGMEPPNSSLMQNQEKKVGVTDLNFALKWLDFARFWVGSQNLRKSSRFRAKLGSVTPTFYS